MKYKRRLLIQEQTYTWLVYVSFTYLFIIPMKVKDLIEILEKIKDKNAKLEIKYRDWEAYYYFSDVKDAYLNLNWKVTITNED